MDSPCHNSIYFSSYQKEAHLISRLCKVNLLTQCNTVNIITSFCPPFFLLSLMCALIPSAWFIFFALSLVFLPLYTSFYSCTTDTSVCISFLCIQNQLSMAQNTKVEEQRNTIMVGQYPALERPQNKLWYVMNQYTVTMATFRDHIWPCYHGILPLRNRQTRVFAAWTLIVLIKSEHQVLNSSIWGVISVRKK